MADEYKEVEMLCMGNYLGNDGKLYIAWVDLDENGERGELHIFRKMKTTKGQPGNVYKTEASKNQIRGRFSYVRMWEPAEERAKIQMQSRNEETEHAALGQRKRMETNDDFILGCIKPLRKAYSSTNHLGKTALIARIILLMQRPY